MKAERARLDAQHAATPKTRLVALVSGGVPTYEGAIGVYATHFEDDVGALHLLADGPPVTKTTGGLGLYHCEHCKMIEGLMTDCAYRGHYRCAASQNKICCECGEELA